MLTWWHDLKQMKSNTISLRLENGLCPWSSDTPFWVCEGRGCASYDSWWRRKESYLESDLRKLSEENRTEILSVESGSSGKEVFVNMEPGSWQSTFSENQPGSFTIRTVVSLCPTNTNISFHKQNERKNFVCDPDSRIESSEAECRAYLVLGTELPDLGINVSNYRHMFNWFNPCWNAEHVIFSMKTLCKIYIGTTYVTFLQIWCFCE